MECPLMHGNIQKETDTDIETEKKITETSGGCVIPVSNK